MSNNNGQKEIEIMVTLLPYIIGVGVIYFVIFPLLGIVIGGVGVAFDLAFKALVFIAKWTVLLFIFSVVLLILISATKGLIKIVSKKDVIGGTLVALGTVATYYFFDEISTLIFHAFLFVYIDALKSTPPLFLINDFFYIVLVATIYLIPLSLYLFPATAHAFIIEKYDEFLVYAQENMNQETRQEKESSYDDFEESPHQSQTHNAKSDDEFSYDGGRFSDDRFTTAKKKASYKAACKAEDDQSITLEERIGYFKFRQRADEGKISGIKALPKP